MQDRPCILSPMYWGCLSEGKTIFFSSIWQNSTDLICAKAIYIYMVPCSPRENNSHFSVTSNLPGALILFSLHRGNTDWVELWYLARRRDNALLFVSHTRSSCGFRVKQAQRSRQFFSSLTIVVPRDFSTKIPGQDSLMPVYPNTTKFLDLVTQKSSLEWVWLDIHGIFRRAREDIEAVQAVIARKARVIVRCKHR